MTVFNAIFPTAEGSTNTVPLWIALVFSVVTTCSTLALKDSDKIMLAAQESSLEKGDTYENSQ